MQYKSQLLILIVRCFFVNYPLFSLPVFAKNKQKKLSPGCCFFHIFLYFVDVLFHFTNLQIIIISQYVIKHLCLIELGLLKLL